METGLCYNDNDNILYPTIICGQFMKCSIKKLLFEVDVF